MKLKNNFIKTIIGLIFLEVICALIVLLTLYDIIFINKAITRIHIFSISVYLIVFLVFLPVVIRYIKHNNNAISLENSILESNGKAITINRDITLDIKSLFIRIKNDENEIIIFRNKQSEGLILEIMKIYDENLDTDFTPSLVIQSNKQLIYLISACYLSGFITVIVLNIFLKDNFVLSMFFWGLAFIFVAGFLLLLRGMYSQLVFEDDGIVIKPIWGKELKIEAEMIKAIIPVTIYKNLVTILMIRHKKNIFPFGKGIHITNHQYKGSLYKLAGLMREKYLSEK